MLLEPLMEQFASNFPVSNNISAANVEWFVRPTHNTDKSLSTIKEGGDGGERGRVGERREGASGPLIPGCWMKRVYT